MEPRTGSSSSRGVPRSTGRRKSMFVSELFWPHTMLDVSQHAFLVGWNLDNFNCCIVNVIALPAGAYDRLNDSLQQVLASCPPGLQATRNATARPVVLGEWFPHGVDEGALPEVRHQEKGIWIVLAGEAIVSKSLVAGRECQWTTSRPKLHSLYSCGCRYSTSCYLFRYDAAKPERHYYLTIDLPKDFGFFKLADDEGSEAGPRLGGGGSAAVARPSTDLERVVEQINSSSYLGHFLDSELKHASPIQSQVGHSAFFKLLLPLSWILVRLCCLRYSFAKHTADVITSAATYAKRLSASTSWTLLEHGSRNSVMRLGKDYHLLHSINHLRRKFLSAQSSFHVYILISRNTALPPVQRQSQWIYLWSYIMTTATDVALGCGVGILLIRCNPEIITFLDSFLSWCQHDILLKGIQWFDSSPGGLKLNPMLTSHIGKILTTIILYFGNLVYLFSGVYKHLLFIMADLGVFGLTMQLAVLVDVLRIGTVHITVIQAIFTTFHRLQVSVLTSMWLLFTGRKKNVLRKRIDTGEYTQSQVVLGTTIFAISFFLFPTFFIYYLAFTCAQLVIVSVCSVVLFLINILLSFPMCHLVLHYWYAESLVQGIHICFDDSQSAVLKRSVIGGPSGSTPVLSTSTRRRVSGSSAAGAANSNSAAHAPSRLERDQKLKSATPHRTELYYSASGDFISKSKGILKGVGSRPVDNEHPNTSSSKVLKFASSNKPTDPLIEHVQGVNSDSASIYIDRNRNAPEIEAVVDSADSSISDSDSAYKVVAEAGRSDKGLHAKDQIIGTISRYLDNTEEQGSLGDVSNPPDDNIIEDVGDFSDSRKYRPLDEYSFSILQVEDESEPSRGSHADNPESIDISKCSGGIGSAGDKFSDFSNSLQAKSGSTPRRPGPPGMSRSSSAAGSPRAAGGVSVKAGSGNSSTYLNILPHKTGVATILSNFIYLWNNKVNRDYMGIYLKELINGIMVGSVSLNLRSLSIVSSYCSHQLKSRVARSSADGPGNNDSILDNGAIEDENVRFDGDIGPSYCYQGDTLIDYFKGGRGFASKFQNIPATPFEIDKNGEVVDRVLSDSDTAGLSDCQLPLFTDGDIAAESVLFERRQAVALVGSPDEYADGSSGQDADGSLRWRREDYFHGGFYRPGYASHCSAPSISDPSDEGGGRDATVRPSEIGATWTGSPDNMSDFWDSLYADCVVDIKRADIVSKTFRVSDLFMALFCIQSLEFLFLAVGVVLLWADVFFLYFPELMPAISYLNVFLKYFGLQS